MTWHKGQTRPMPWKGVKDPYLIWLSEIILQQTRVEQGMPYFMAFSKKYPKVEDLAHAPEDDVMKLWQGLGYYSRARNLHFTAKYITNELNGVFPDNFEKLLNLKGVGEYTAAAIASFAYEEPVAVVDGNVYRVLSRYFGIKTPIDSLKGKKEFKSLANQLIDRKQPDKYNQAIMDFGATWCTPKLPRCENCIMQDTCYAYKKEALDTLPVKEKKLKKRKRYFNFLVIQNEEKTYLEKRTNKDIWQNLYQFPLIETKTEVEYENLKSEEDWTDIFNKFNPKLLSKSKVYKQVLTHQNIDAVFWTIELKQTKLSGRKFLSTNAKDINSYAFPKIIDCFIKDNPIYLSHEQN